MQSVKNNKNEILFSDLEIRVLWLWKLAGKRGTFLASLTEASREFHFLPCMMGDFFHVFCRPAMIKKKNNSKSPSILIYIATFLQEIQSVLNNLSLIPLREFA